MELLRTPWKTRLLDLVKQAKQSVKITSPYVKANICQEIIEAKSNDTKLELITSFQLPRIYNGSLDLAGVEHILENDGVVKNYSRLHSKIYIFDDVKAIVTSSNLTNGGLITNFEYGVLIEEINLVRKIVDDFINLSSQEKTGMINREIVNEARKILSKIPKIASPKFPELVIETPEFSGDTLLDSVEAIQSSLKSWKLDIFNCLNVLPNQVIKLSEIYVFEDKLQRMHPENQNIRAKIRQQLQYLRDLGLLEFMSDGQYRKLWS